ncbi:MULTISPECIES: hypothetical protein [Colwellia]|uniref:Uncharacterized protein n=1 Tax=Colwellia marinimaniae TaxID=1513592 RepID=A0ABQ0MWU3_9GAMM|nr:MULTISPECIES: hypothetical protein [Colwellia]GAW96841.1 hypothetical protein MTCD1_02464 [Colwellia marinimaniae]
MFPLTRSQSIKLFSWQAKHLSVNFENDGYQEYIAADREKLASLGEIAKIPNI